MIRLCQVRGCHAQVQYGSRCATHNRARERTRPKAGRGIYSTKRWWVLRRKVLSQQPWCQYPGCGELATDVHHKVDIAKGGEVWAMDNLEPLCHAHHTKHHMQQRARETEPSL